MLRHETHFFVGDLGLDYKSRIIICD